MANLVFRTHAITVLADGQKPVLECSPMIWTFFCLSGCPIYIQAPTYAKCYLGICILKYDFLGTMQDIFLYDGIFETYLYFLQDPIFYLENATIVEINANDSSLIFRFTDTKYSKRFYLELVKLHRIPNRQPQFQNFRVLTARKRSMNV